jgi:hypothetical protein
MAHAVAEVEAEAVGARAIVAALVFAEADA